MLISYAARPGSTAEDGEGPNSPYSAALLEHIRTPALEVRRMLDKVANSVVTATHGRQEPWLSQSPLPRNFFFQPGPDPAEEAFEAARHFDRQSVDTRAAIAKYRAVVQGFPGSNVANQAKGRIRELERIENTRNRPPPTADKRAMIYVPGGKFLSGCGRDKAHCTEGKTEEEKKEERESGENNLESRDVAAFWIDKREVTVAAYRQCVEAKQCSEIVGTPEPQNEPDAGKYCTWNQNDPQLPINCVSWSQAEAYCKWAKKRLPSDMEWEKAARGKDGRESPWGSRQNIQVANIADETLRNHERWEMTWKGARDVEITVGYTDEHMEIAPVGSYPAGASPYGVLDMSGNVWEWVADWYKKDEARYRRGGSWLSHLNRTRTFFHAWRDPSHHRTNIGFRCALTPTVNSEAFLGGLTQTRCQPPPSPGSDYTQPYPGYLFFKPRLLLSPVYSGHTTRCSSVSRMHQPVGIDKLGSVGLGALFVG